MCMMYFVLIDCLVANDPRITSTCLPLLMRPNLVEDLYLHNEPHSVAFVLGTSCKLFAAVRKDFANHRWSAAILPKN